MNFSRFASDKENVTACKAKPTSNLKDIILIPFYCTGICFGALVYLNGLNHQNGPKSVALGTIYVFLGDRVA